MSKRLFGDWYYSLENSYNTKTEAERVAKDSRKLATDVNKELVRQMKKV